MDSIDRLVDITNDDRFFRHRDEMSPMIRNSLVYVLQKAARGLRELNGDDDSDHHLGIGDVDTQHIKARAPKDREKATIGQLSALHTAVDLRPILIHVQGSDGPVDDMDEMVKAIDHALVGLVDARQWITRNSKSSK